MGKTGTTLWAQVKGVKGQIRLVPKKEGEVKDPGTEPAVQSRCKCQADRSGCRSDGRTRWPRRTSWRGRRGGDRSGGSGLNESTANPMIRSRMRRAKVSALGAKAKSSR